MEAFWCGKSRWLNEKTALLWPPAGDVEGASGLHLAAQKLRSPFLGAANWANLTQYKWSSGSARQSPLQRGRARGTLVVFLTAPPYVNSEWESCHVEKEEPHEIGSGDGQQVRGVTCQRFEQ